MQKKKGGFAEVWQVDCNALGLPLKIEEKSYEARMLFRVLGQYIKGLG